MSESYLRQSPLAHIHINATSDNNDMDSPVSITEIAHRMQFALRGAPSDKAFVKITGDILSVPLPTKPCQSSGNADDIHAHWMGPDEWLIIAPKSSNADIGDRLKLALAKHHASVTDVSDSRTTIRLAGLKARETLTKGCSIDLHPRQFTKGSVVNTLLAQSHITLHQITDTDNSGACTYDILVHRSFSEYLWLWLQDAVREYG